MEPIVLLIISLIVGSFLNGGKKKTDSKEKSKPFTAAGNPSSNGDTFKKLKDFSRDFYEEIQKEFQPEEEAPSKQPATVSKAEPVTQQASPAPALQQTIPVRKPREHHHRGRLSQHGGTVKRVKEERHIDLIPKTEQDLLKGIVYSEIFGPPKAKR